MSSLTVTDRDGSKLELAPQGGGKYTFEMPSSSVTIRAVFVPEELPFVDVKPTDWFYDAVSYVYWSSMMDGVSADRFAPDSDVTPGYGLDGIGPYRRRDHHRQRLGGGRQSLGHGERHL